VAKNESAGSRRLANVAYTRQKNRRFSPRIEYREDQQKQTYAQRFYQDAIFTAFCFCAIR
jgi:hypothetical protein